jgi:8-oxo-dGTP pyrophosphatase MutT (NUDIX family)
LTDKASSEDLSAIRSALATHTPTRYSVGARAAVLVPLHPSQDGLQLLYTKRPDTLRAHPGQVSFPGGRVEDEDADERAAALREAEEELGLDPKDAEVIGQLDDVVTGTGFTITPIVAVFARMPVLRPNAVEVADWFWFPLARLQDEAGWKGLDITREGRVYKVWFFDGAPHTIWGATAAMTRQLLELLE